MAQVKPTYQKKESKTIFSDEKIELGWMDTSKTVKRTVRVAWDERYHKLLEAKVTVSAKPSSDRNYFDAYLDGNNIIHLSWDIGDTASKTGSKDVTDSIRNGDNIFECSFSKFNWWPTGVSVTFTEILDLTWEVQEGVEPPKPPEQTKGGLTNTEWIAIGVGVGGAALGAAALLRREKKK